MISVIKCLSIFSYCQDIGGSCIWNDTIESGVSKQKHFTIFDYNKDISPAHNLHLSHFASAVFLIRWF